MRIICLSKNTLLLGLYLASAMLTSCNMDSLPGVQSEKQAGSTREGALTVKILPEAPTAIMDIHAIVTGKSSGTMSYRWDHNGMALAGENSAYLSSNKRFAKGDRITVTVTEGDKTGSASVTILNTLPVITSVLFMPVIIHRGVDIVAEPAGSDADNDPMLFKYRWFINDDELSENSPVLRGDRFKRGDRIWVKVAPFDNEDEGPSFTSRTLVIPNGPPKFVSAPPAGFQSETYSYQAVAEDPDDDVLKYSLVSAPKGMTIGQSTGLITLKIGKEHVGTHAIEVMAEDPQGLQAVQKYSLSLSVP